MVKEVVEEVVSKTLDFRDRESRLKKAEEKREATRRMEVDEEEIEIERQG